MLFSLPSRTSWLSKHPDPPKTEKRFLNEMFLNVAFTFMKQLYLHMCDGSLLKCVLLPWIHTHQKHPCHWGDGPHTGSAAAPEQLPSGCTSALHPGLSC